MFKIQLGVPEIEAFWAALCEKMESATISKEDEKLYKKLGKAMALLANDPRHPGLRSHEIEALTRRYGMKVWQSYLENKTSGAGRIYWVYGPDARAITVIGIEPHPEDKKKDGYEKVRLSAAGKEE